ncbi:LON peptidase substrate-binding domain-containing protein [Sphingomonas sp. ID0503]|uniref:LON peptidase substrate-binding domain-containing protein n=1 Tax=Sphingomonas sp. ID0503 TaxID=3399691 RepID=UPI003AFA32F8
MTSKAETQRLSLFPLAGAILFPRMHLPLHIFEGRYRALVSDAMARDRRIGMVQPRDAKEPPALYDIGCVGHIIHVQALEDGRFNLLLEGVARFRITGERTVTTPFRQVDAILGILPDDDTEPLTPVMRAALEEESRRFAQRRGYAIDWDAVSRLDDEALVNGMAQAVPFDVASKQALVEAPTVTDRASLMIDFMQFTGAGDDGGTLQ